MVLRGIRIAESGVRLPVGPHIYDHKKYKEIRGVGDRRTVDSSDTSSDAVHQ